MSEQSNQRKNDSVSSFYYNAWNRLSSAIHTEPDPEPDPQPPNPANTLNSKRSVRFNLDIDQQRAVPVFMAAPPRGQPFYAPPQPPCYYNNAFVGSIGSINQNAPISGTLEAIHKQELDFEREVQKEVHTIECLKPAALGLSLSSLIMGLPCLSIPAVYFALKSPSKGGKRRHYCLSITLAIIAIFLAITLAVGLYVGLSLPHQITHISGFGENIRYSDGMTTCWCTDQYLETCRCSKRLGNGKFDDFENCHCTYNRVCDCEGWTTAVSFFVR